MFHRTFFGKRLQTVIRYNKYERRKKQYLNAVFYPQVVKLVLNRPPPNSILARQSSYPAPHYQSLTADSTDGGGDTFGSLNELSPTQDCISVCSQLSCGGSLDSLGQRMQAQLSGKSQTLSFVHHYSPFSLTADLEVNLRYLERLEVEVCIFFISFLYLVRRNINTKD